MNYLIEQSVKSQIEQDFAEADQATVEGMLASTKLWAENSGPPPRVHHAFLKMADGNLERLKKTLESYAGDWRDALVNCGLGDENWKDILRKQGIEPNEWKC
jgi:hypothetical protein